MKVHVLQHVNYEGIGSMALWLEDHGAKVSYTRFFEDSVLPRAMDYDLVIVMGGPMSANDESTLPWLRLEKEFIRDAVEGDVSVLGVCLGAQLIASALGARVYENPEKEIGWFQIEAAGNVTNTFRFPDKCTVFHWHGETFDLPSVAVRLAKNSVCENQAFQIGQHIIGLQFHLESTLESVQSILDNCGNELIPGPYVQTANNMLRIKSADYAEINSLMEEVLTYVTRY